MVTSLQYMHRHVGDCVDQVYRTHAEKQAELKIVEILCLGHASCSASRFT